MPYLEIELSEESLNVLNETALLLDHRIPAQRVASLALEAFLDVETPNSLKTEILEAIAQEEDQELFNL